MMDSLVSVIVPVYMIEPYIEKCVDSIRRQSYAQLEIILVDDGSTDHCGAILDGYKKMDGRIRVIHKENGGLVSARKAGISEASGKYVMYVDGDDWVDPDHVSGMAEIIEKENADVVTGQYYYEGETAYKMGDTLPTGAYELPDELRILRENMLAYGGNDDFQFGITPFLWNKVFRRELLEKFQNRVPDGVSVGEDAVCIYPLLMAAKKVVLSGRCSYHYRIRKTSMSNDKENKEPDDRFLRRHFVMTELLDDPADADVLKPQIEKYFGWNLMNLRFSGLFDRAHDIFLPYHLKRGSRIIIYGLGRHGKKLKGMLEGFCEIAAYTDKLAYGREEYEGVRIVCPKDVAKMEYDYVLIAVRARPSEASISRYLALIGVPEQKLLTVASDYEIAKYAEYFREVLGEAL